LYGRQKKGDRGEKEYKVRIPRLMFLELFMGLYCAGSLGYYLWAGKFLIGPFLALYSAGFLFIGLLTMAENFRIEK